MGINVHKQFGYLDHSGAPRSLLKSCDICWCWEAQCAPVKDHNRVDVGCESTGRAKSRRSLGSTVRDSKNFEGTIWHLVNCDQSSSHASKLRDDHHHLLCKLSAIAAIRFRCLPSVGWRRCCELYTSESKRSHQILWAVAPSILRSDRV